MSKRSVNGGYVTTLWTFSWVLTRIGLRRTDVSRRLKSILAARYLLNQSSYTLPSCSLWMSICMDMWVVLHSIALSKDSACGSDHFQSFPGTPLHQPCWQDNWQGREIHVIYHTLNTVDQILLDLTESTAGMVPASSCRKRRRLPSMFQEGTGTASDYPNRILPVLCSLVSVCILE